MWRFDIAFPQFKLYIEIEGGSWGRQVTCNHCTKPVFRISKKNGRRIPVREGMAHTTGEGYEKNLEKYNSAGLLGWKGLRFTSGMVRDGRAIEIVKSYFANTQPRQPNQADLFGDVPKEAK